MAEPRKAKEDVPTRGSAQWIQCGWMDVIHPLNARSKLDEVGFSRDVYLVAMREMVGFVVSAYGWRWVDGR